jgi:hypothetical protein
MRPSLRFLALALVGWAGVRLAILDGLPGSEMFRIERSEAKPSAIVPTQFPDIAPVEPAASMYPAAGYPTASPPPGMSYAPGVAPPLVVPIYYRYVGAPDAPPMHPARFTPIIPASQPIFYSPVPQLDDWPLSRIASASMPARSPPTFPLQIGEPPLQPRLDRIQLTMWAMLRQQQTAVAGSPSLGNNGTLGASQAGTRLTYNFSPAFAASLRASSTVGRRGGEVAGGIRYRPLQSIPVWVTVERRQAIGSYGGGRSAFALFAEGGLWDQPIPYGFTLDGYVQGGVVGLNSRDLFADGGLTFSRPIYKQFSAGLGVWGGVQPGLYRVDAGPRVTMKVRRNLKVHFDWRQKLAGNARPGSGPAVTLAGDF